MPTDGVRHLPFISADLPGIGGRLKAEAADFLVEELPLYEPEGTGEHLYVRIRRSGRTTRDIETSLARLFDLADVDVGCAGLKDKNATAEQTFSLRGGAIDPEAAAARIAFELGVEVLWTKRHKNKLRRGHLLGNRFTILLSDVGPDALARAEAVRARLVSGLWPNFYGVQRFGLDGSNAALGADVLRGRGPRQRWLRRFVLSSWQSALFNVWLTERIERGDFGRILRGDVAKKTDFGGLFDVLDPVVEQARFDRGEITYTGPMFGAEMRAATNDAATHEASVLAAAGFATADLTRARLEGTRRPAALRLKDISVVETERGLRFAFALPKGSYATTLLREFTKVDDGLPEGDDE